MKPILVLSAVNVGATLLLVLLVSSALVGSLAPAAYRMGLIGLLVGYVALWVKLERDQGRGRHVALRGARALAALALALVVTPMLVLTPVFSLETQLPPSADFDTVSARSMILVRLASQSLVASNLLAVLVALVVAAVLRLRARTTP